MSLRELALSRECLRGHLTPREACAYALAALAHPAGLYTARLALEEAGVVCHMTRYGCAPGPVSWAACLTWPEPVWVRQRIGDDAVEALTAVLRDVLQGVA